MTSNGAVRVEATLPEMAPERRLKICIRPELIVLTAPARIVSVPFDDDGAVDDDDDDDTNIADLEALPVRRSGDVAPVLYPYTCDR